MNRRWLLTAAISGFLAVAFGAFGAHALKTMLSDSDVAIWQTAVQYQMFHTLALLGLACLDQNSNNRLLLWSGRLFGAGIVVFCGSLYVMALTGQRWLGAITPFGGVAFLAGWAALAVVAYKNNR